MFTEDFSVFDFASGIAEAVDLVSPDLNNHHKQVAYIAYNIAKEMHMTDEEIQDIVLASILHDIGAFTCEDRYKVVYAKFNDSEFNQHQVMGYKLLKNFEPFQKAADLIRYHHAFYTGPSDPTPMGCFIIHLADRVSVLLDKRREILEQVPEIMNKIYVNQSKFPPETIDALYRIAEMEYFWIEACLLPNYNLLSEKMRFSKKNIDLDTLKSLAKVISQIIDFRSRFTSTHSCGVAAVAYELTKICGFSENECRLMEIAGYLHDIGKLAIANEILEKHGALNYEEFNEMRKHTYYTYIILSRIKGFEEIAICAAYHHERLDGKGYPFHVKGENFTKLARIIAVADIVTAITEDRPYRAGMNSDKALEILSDMVDNGGIDKDIVELVHENFPRINNARIKAQQAEQRVYNDFYNFTLSAEAENKKNPA